MDEIFQGKSIKGISSSLSSCSYKCMSCLGLIWGKEQNKEGRKQKKYGQGDLDYQSTLLQIAAIKQWSANSQNTSGPGLSSSAVNL